jgi:ribosome biogenesis GTPase / thiamine phosphate phosphatase
LKNATGTLPASSALSLEGGCKVSVIGEVLFGINTIYTVRVQDRELTCRIKGKVLPSAARSYNPIAPGDQVEVDPDLHSAGEGRITAVKERRTLLTRWNKKGRAPQLLAANADLAVCVCTPASPPFRPRFIDRLIVAAESGGLRPIILLNKADLGTQHDTADRLEFYRSLGYSAMICSARTGEGVAAVCEALAGLTAVLVGQSGVGKSSLLNAMDPSVSARVGSLSAKYNRGVHTTNFAALLHLRGGLRVIDTPGIRELELADVLPEELPFHFREFSAYLPSCQYAVCLHADEPGCAVRAAVENGEIHHDRYESYLRTLHELKEGRR